MSRKTGSQSGRSVAAKKRRLERLKKWKLETGPREKRDTRKPREHGLPAGPRLCWRCGVEFMALEAQGYCAECSAIMLARKEPGYKRLIKKQLLLAPIVEQPRHTWDFRIIDENGREVWALDLAERYRRELRKRQHGVFAMEE